jgi:predicted alpha/beta-hydrolase family hydrolase
VTPFLEGGVRGFLHEPGEASGKSLVLTHGAGGNCGAPLLVAVAEAFCAAGYRVLRCDMAFRQRRASGSPSPATSGQDRESLREAVGAMRRLAKGPVILGGLSYGGRQSTMLAAEDASVAESLLLLSYPLHPPGKPAQQRTAHFPSLRIPGVFVHGTKDPFGTVEEMRAALALIPAKKEFMIVEGAGHDLKRGKFDVGKVVGVAGTLSQ